MLVANLKEPIPTPISRPRPLRRGPEAGELCYIARVNKYVTFALLAGVLLLAACGKSMSKQIQEQVAQFNGTDLDSKNVEILKLYKVQGRMVAEIRVKTAVMLSKKEDKWTIEQIRIGDRRWADADAVMAVINKRLDESTLKRLKEVSQGLDRYLAAKGEVPNVTQVARLMDLLNPEYMPEAVFSDSRGNPLCYRRLSERRYEVRSAGPDGRLDTADDLVLRN